MDSAYADRLGPRQRERAISVQPTSGSSLKMPPVHPPRLDADNASSALRRACIVLPLLSFGAGAADAFAFVELGGVFTANMTGNAVVAALFDSPDHAYVFVSALTAIGMFAFALVIGFRLTRRCQNYSSLLALALSAACHATLVLLWWFAPHDRAGLIGMISASAGAMGFQTVAAKRDGVKRGPPTTYATGTLTDLLLDVVDGTAALASARWYPLCALPLGAASSVAVRITHPELTPFVPLCATTLCIMLIGYPFGRIWMSPKTAR